MARFSLPLAAAGMALLTACEPVRLAPSAAAPPAARATAAPDDGPSPLSRALRRYYERVQADLLARGLLRTDGGTRDAPYDAETLVRNFRRIALYEEYTHQGGRIVAQETESRLHRWEDPVRLAVEFGGTVPKDQRIADRRAVERYAARIDRITGHPVTAVERDGNFHVFILDEDARRALGPRLEEIIPGISSTAVRAVTHLPRSTYCLVFAWDPEDDGSYAKAVAIIRAEHPDLLRLSCIHEEIAQGMGLANDSPEARPSIFNDDEEFGLLTRHDAELLSLLYNPRLRPGMTAKQALPIVRDILGLGPDGPS